jgi:hypothetical protein
MSNHNSKSEDKMLDRAGARFIAAWKVEENWLGKGKTPLTPPISPPQLEQRHPRQPTTTTQQPDDTAER